MTRARRRICVVTGSRAEYGLLRWLIQEVRDDPRLELQLAVTGMHLSPEFGLTFREIEADGFRIDERIEMLLSSDTPVGVAKGIGLGVIGFAEALARLRPDVLVVLGDRYEILAAAQAAMTARIPIAHLHGGESSEGAIDESIRHAITKMAHLHFVAAEPYRRRVIQLGEEPRRVFNYGAPGLDAIERLTLLGREALERSLSFELGATFFLVTYHPVTLAARPSDRALRGLLGALDRFPEARILFTKGNADAEGRVLNEMIDAYAVRHAGRVKVATSLGHLRYLSAVAGAAAVIGNSSSGIIEAPALGVPTVNVGDRQRGRLKARSVIDCAEGANAIRDAIRRALTPAFRAQARSARSLYGAGDASRRIKEKLRTIDLDGIVRKRFHSLS